MACLDRAWCTPARGLGSLGAGLCWLRPAWGLSTSFMRGDGASFMQARAVCARELVCCCPTRVLGDFRRRLDKTRLGVACRDGGLSEPVRLRVVQCLGRKGSGREKREKGKERKKKERKKERERGKNIPGSLEFFISRLLFHFHFV